MLKKSGIFLIVVLCFGFAGLVFAHLPRIVGDKIINIQDPEISQAFYGELKDQPAEYNIFSSVDFDLYVNILVPKSTNSVGRYSVNIFQVKDEKEELFVFVDGMKDPWQEIWEEYGRDFYLKGPEFEEKVEAGEYKIIISGSNNQGKYVLAVGKKEQFTWQELLKVYYILPLLKLNFFQTSVLEFFITPFFLFGAMSLVAIFIIITLIFFLIGKAIKRSKPKSILD